jgi:glutamate-ammonia-ligase adenylyltransferase
MSPDTRIVGEIEGALAALPEVLRHEVAQACAVWEGLEGWTPRVGEVLRVWAASRFVASAARRDPGQFQALLASGDLDRAYGPGEMTGRVGGVVEGCDAEPGLMRALRRLRGREMLRIAWRDLGGSAGLDETLRDLSELAEHCVDRALEWAYDQACQRHGVPRNAAGQAQRMVVLGMGKLGGGELNFSSDIDLIFAYPDKGVTDGRRDLENSQFFIRVAQRLIRLLNEPTQDGIVFRVDMRLRPFGEAGPLVTSFDAMEDYYQEHGRDWERYALIKARAMAGDVPAGEALIQRLRPFIYRRYLDFGAIEALRKMKTMINDEIRRRGLGDNIKLGAGGIRELEFIGQAFQLIRGGRDTDLQQRSIQRVLRLLGDKRLLPPDAVEKLLTAYRFLRRSENRLQMMEDRQTHVLPTEAPERERLAFAMGYRDWGGFVHQLEVHRLDVRSEFDRVFASPRLETPGPQGEDGPASGLISLWRGGLNPAQAHQVLEQAGFREPGEACAALERFRASRAYRLNTPLGRARLDRLMPLLVSAAGQGTDPDAVLPRLLALLDAIAQRSVYVALLVEHPLALSQLVRLAAASAWIAEYLTHHPILLDELLDPRGLYAPLDKAGLAREAKEQLGHVPEDDLEGQMERLRQFKQANVLRVAAADVTGVLPLMQVSDQLTGIAEVVLAQVSELCETQLARKYGRPRCSVDGQLYRPGFAIVGYGKLGGIELGYGSDLDIVFLHDSTGGVQHTDGERPVDNGVFFARLGQRIIHMLTAYTPAGILYEVDARLRPSGKSGLLVSPLQAFESYQRTEAWTWEHQALVRARMVVGGPRMGEAFAGIRREILTQPRDPGALRKAVQEMRERMWERLGSGSGSRFDIKHDPGGITDIEFMVQYSVLAHAHAHPALCEHTDNIRILDGLVQCRLIPVLDAQAMKDIYRLYRDRVHALSLQGASSIVGVAEFLEHRDRVRRLWREWIDPDG